MNKLASLLLVSSSLLTFAAEMLTPVYAVFAEEIGGDLLTAGIAYSLFWISGGIFIYLMSKVEEKEKDLGKYIFTGYTLQSIGFLAMIFISEPIHLFIVEVIFGVGSAIATPAYDGMFSKLLGDNVVSGWGTWEAVTYLTMGASSAFGGYIAQFMGFKALLIFIFAISMIATTLSYKIMQKNEYLTFVVGELLIERENNHKKDQK